jgi:dephospho-CoA kinase
MYLVGLTGGIGSGKSTVARELAERGCEIVDADAIAREVVAEGEPALEELVARFGSGILAEDGTLDRAALASLAFADDDARHDLDRITHPRIAARMAERIAQLGTARGAAPDQLVVVDHPLLVETGQAGRFDAVLVVLADEDRRVRRLVERGLTEQDARARLAAQTSDAGRRAAATHVIVNDGTLAELTAAVDDVHRRLLDAARRRP